MKGILFFSQAVDKIEKNITSDEDRLFFWKENQIPEAYSIYRVEDSEGNKRSMDSEGNKRSMDDVPSEQISLSEIDLILLTIPHFYVVWEIINI